MAGLWQRTGNATVTNGSRTVTGFGTKWKTGTLPIQKGHAFYGPDGVANEVDTVVSDTEILLVEAYRGGTMANQPYKIDITRTSTISQFSAELSALVGKYRTWFDSMMTWLTGSGDVGILNPDTGATVTIPSWEKVASEGEGQAARAKVEADRAKAAADSINAETSENGGKLMRAGGPAILDSERYSLERATGGRQTIIRDSAGNANAMFVLPRFRYEDLGMAADMGAGDVTAFDFGSGSIKSEIFIGAYMASAAGAVSAPRQEPRASIDHTAARAACAVKGQGWHLMTVHEWAAIALWCMASGYEPLGNTNWGRSHARTWLTGDRPDGRAPGDSAGIGRTLTGSMGAEATHDRTLGGIADLVGNAWEWQDGLLLQGGQIKASTHNTQPEANWALQAAFFDAPSSVPVLSNAITRAASVNADWKSMAKSAGYVSNSLLKRLLIEPASVLPGGRIYTNNDGERLPFRGGGWDSGAGAGLASLSLSFPRSYTYTYLGFRPAFA
ncbi:hypothetical protein [Aeromonas sobria]|uniref:hypothetical protein n=1 Tax=Aeromonas sobria TaxID=646 RepID=UPI0026E9E84F|nr:hypothetical protein [Aeromonas sobria]